jgi:hypothetical protein
MHDVPPPPAIIQPDKIENVEPEGTHYQTDGPVAVDVLVILDTSCSMNDDENAIANISVIPNDLLTKPDISWRLGIVPADPERIDLLTEIDLRDPYPDELMNVAVGELFKVAPWEEKSLDTAVAVYDETTWFRGVFTIFVVVTDERDQSAIQPIDLLYVWPTRFDFVAVTGINDSEYICGAQHAPDLISLSTKHIDICAPDPWSILN